VLGTLLGLALALSLVFVLESLDRRVKSVEEFEREYRLPAIATIPQSAFRHPRAEERSRELEPYRILRSSLDLAAVTRDLDTLLVTSATEGEGKTTVAVDLAHTVALDGRRVVLVELDLRRPTFANHFGQTFRQGLTLALAGGMSASEFLVEPFLELPNLSILPAGPLPPNPAEMLASGAVGDMLAQLAPKDGILIVDAPPLNPVADTHELLISGAIKAPLIVARLNKTTRDAARHARAVLARHMIEPVGLVVTGVRGGVGYGYEAHAAAGGVLESNGSTPRRSAAGGRRVSI
jgi:capsular exopolysaccharide synthesis family protein